MNKTDIKGFKEYMGASPPTSLLPQNLPDKWLHKLLDEAALMDYESHKPGENWDAITMATLAICSEKIRRGQKVQLSSEKMLDYVQYYANLIRIEVIQRETPRRNDAKQRPDMFITNNLALPATIANIFTDRPPKITRITPGRRQTEDTALPPQKGHIIITGQGATGTFLANHLIYEKHSSDDTGRIWIIDAAAKYKILTNLIGGTYTKVATGTGPAPNPFAGADGSHQDIRLLLPILEEMASPSHNTTPEQAATLRKALRDSIAAHGKATTVKHVVHMLRQESQAATNIRRKNAILALAQRLERSAGPFYRGKFTSRVSPKAKIITYALDDDKTDGTNNAAALMCILYRIFKAIEKDRRTARRNFVILDNMLPYVDNERAVNYIMRIYRKAESLGATTLTMAEATSDFLTKETMKRFLNRKPSTVSLVRVPPGFFRELMEKVWHK
jgi:hypothetical protein